MSEGTGAKDIIQMVLDDYDTDAFVQADWSDVAAAKIVSELEWHNFKIVKMERVAKPAPPLKTA